MEWVEKFLSARIVLVLINGNYSMLVITLLLSCFLLHSVRTRSSMEMNITLEWRSNETIILWYNLTSHYSYLITFRSFGSEQVKFGLFPPTKQFEEHSIDISYRSNASELVDLFIICFHFLLPSNELDIQCKDLRSFESKTNTSSGKKDFLPSYNPLFVPLMYALSVLMLLPVIVQHHRRKKAQAFRRRTEIRRWSVSISRDPENPKRNFAQKIFSQIMKNGTINYEKPPIGIELVSSPSTKALLDDRVGHANDGFSLDNLSPSIHDNNDYPIEIDAHECIAHLLDNTPWTTPYQDQPLGTRFARHSVVLDSATALKGLRAPTIISMYDDEDDGRPILQTRKYSTDSFSRRNRAFIESDV